MTSLAAQFDSTESVLDTSVANDAVPTINHPANTRKHTRLISTFLSKPTK